jgi:hypothetical protein
MVFRSLMYTLTIFTDFFTILGIPFGDKDLEIVLLRQQVRILQRTVKTSSTDYHSRKKDIGCPDR